MERNAYQELLEAYKENHLPVVLTASEVMDILGVGKNTVYRLLNSGELICVWESKIFILIRPLPCRKKGCGSCHVPF